MAAPLYAFPSPIVAPPCFSFAMLSFSLHRSAFPQHRLAFRCLSLLRPAFPLLSISSLLFSSLRLGISPLFFALHRSADPLPLIRPSMRCPANPLPCLAYHRFGLRFLCRAPLVPALPFPSAGQRFRAFSNRIKAIRFRCLSKQRSAFPSPGRAHQRFAFACRLCALLCLC